MGVHAYDKVIYKGVTVDRKTKRALEWVEENSGVEIQLSQGSYNPGGVSASGTTHNGGGAVDIRTSILTERQRKRLVRFLKLAGFAAWYRGPGSGFAPHIHAIQVGNTKASASAKWQVNEFDAHRSGLSTGGYDRTFRPDPPVKFNFKKRKPVPR